jgi:transposase
VEPAAQPRPSYEDLVAALAERDERIAVGERRIEALEALVAELSRKLGVDSQNSSKPPSSDGPGARAERRRAERERRRSEPAEGPKPRKKRGGQDGHAGRGLEFTANPDVVLPPVEPVCCGGCGADLAGAPQVKVERLQVVDIPEVQASVTELHLVSRRCGCGAISAGAAPAGVPGGPVCYGPNLTAAAALVHAHGQVGNERTAEVVNALFGTVASAGWVGKVAGRLAGALFGFEADVKTALLCAPVLLADETAVNTIEDDAADDAAGDGVPRSFNPHVFTLRSPTIVWLGAGHTRGHAALDAFDVFGRYTGTLVTDDYGGYVKYEDTLSARQLCNAHLIRSLRGVDSGGVVDGVRQDWAKVLIKILRAGRQAVKAAIAAGREALTGEEIEEIRAGYLMWAESGIVENTGRRKPDGKKHEAWVLAQRLKDKIDLVLHHLTDFRVPWTSNLAEQALRHVKVHLKISGCFRTLATTRAYCRIHSYLITTRLHGVPPMQAIRDALAGRAWTPLRAVEA